MAKKDEERGLQTVGEVELIARPDVIALAIEKGATPEVIGQMMELQERHDKNEARKAYHVAMARFKANPPKLNKDAHVRYKTSKGVTEYTHATLANITDKISSRLSEEGLSAAWETKQGEKGAISVTCKITHILGHSESTTLEAAPDDSGGKNSIQAIGSTVTYLQRYTLLSMAGLATADMDDDGRGSEGEDAEYISEEQLVIINEYFDSLKVDVPQFKKYMKVDEVGKILASNYNRAISLLKEKERKMAQGDKK